MNMQLISNWRDGWKFYSAWAFAAIMALPELYTLVAPLLSLEEFPAPAKRLMQLAALVGLVSRFLKQVRPAEPDDTDLAGA